MATVFSNSMVAHVWAQGRQGSGRSHNGNFYFEGRALYSYGSHFVVAYLMPDGRALMNAESYSISTSRHQSEARAAVNYSYLTIPELTALVNGYGLYWLEKADDAETRERARSAIFRHVQEHALRYDDDSALYLLGKIGRARSWPKLKREAERKAAKAKAARKAREIAARKAEAERMAALNDSRFADLLAEKESARVWGRFPSPSSWRGREYRHARPSEALAQFATELHRLRVAAKAHCGKRVQSTLAARLKTTRARVRQLAKWESHGETLAAYARAKAAARELWAKRASTGPLSRDANARLGRLVEYLATTRPGLLTAHAREQLALIKANCDALEAEAAEREAAERMERERAAREEWLAGGGHRWTRFSDAKGGAMLRARDVERDESGAIIGGTLETSHGADVPLVHAMKAFAFVRRVVATGQPWHANGHCIRVGHFRVDSIDADGTMQAGCHTIHLGEMERLAAALGVADIAPDDSALELSKGAA